MIKEKAKAPLFKLPSTGKNEFNFKDTFILIKYFLFTMNIEIKIK